MNSKPELPASSNPAQQLQAALQLERQGRLADASQAYRALLAADPSKLELLPNFGRLLLLQGQAKEASEVLGRAAARFPKSALVLTNLGLALAMQGERKRAIATYWKAIAADPNYVLAHFNLGRALADADRPEEARAALEEAIRLAPGHVDAHCALAGLLEKRKLHRDALASYRRALDARPHDPFILYNLGNAHLTLAEAPEALDRLSQALSIMPSYGDAHHAIGLALQMLGRFDDAAKHHREAVRLAPTNGLFLRDLVELEGADDRLLEQMEKLARDPEQADTKNCMQLHAGLGAAFRSRGEHDKAFRHFLAANSLVRGNITYDEKETESYFSGLRVTYTKERLKMVPDHAPRSDLPIFIVGMPRSGSTLVEQILGSHSGVFGAGEVRDLPSAMESIGRGPFDSVEFLVRKLSPAQLASIGNAYLLGLKARAPSALRITDKFLSNFLRIGLIRMVLPNARIVHTVRNPVDVCVSRFTRVFVPGNDYSYDLAELGRYHRHYEKLMEYWRSVLPPGAMHEIVYEDLIANPEEQVRGLLNYCGLEWEEACLEFHASSRTVGTPSRRQVRERLYTTSVGTWTRYKEHLDPLFKALEIAPPA